MPKETFKGNLGDLVDIVLGGLGNKKRKARFKKKDRIARDIVQGRLNPVGPTLKQAGKDGPSLINEIARKRKKEQLARAKTKKS